MQSGWKKYMEVKKMDALVLLEMATAHGKVNAFVDGMKDISDNMFLSAVCMILEEGCKQRNIDVVEMADQLQKVVHDVNEELGKY